VLQGVFEAERPIAPKLAEFENYLQRTLEAPEADREVAVAAGA
jgi:hypothetical protein